MQTVSGSLQNKAKLLGTGELFDQPTAQELINAAFELPFPKVDFAIDLILNGGWQTPKYIAGGLHWLAQQRP